MSNDSRDVAFIGLGVMGYHMAGHLAKAGHSVTVYNRTGAKAEQWVAEFGGRRADTPQAAAEGAVHLFLDERKAAPGLRDDLGPDISLWAPESLGGALDPARVGEAEKVEQESAQCALQSMVGVAGKGDFRQA